MIQIKTSRVICYEYIDIVPTSKTPCSAHFKPIIVGDIMIQECLIIFIICGKLIKNEVL